MRSKTKLHPLIIHMITCCVNLIGASESSATLLDVQSGRRRQQCEKKMTRKLQRKSVQRQRLQMLLDIKMFLLRKQFKIDLVLKCKFNCFYLFDMMIPEAQPVPKGSRVLLTYRNNICFCAEHFRMCACALGSGGPPGQWESE